MNNNGRCGEVKRKEGQLLETFLAVQFVKTSFPMQEAWAQSLVRELRSYMPCSHTHTKKKKTREKETVLGKMGYLAFGGHQTLSPSLFLSISLVEPGPVITEFEGKLLEQVSTAEFPGTDPDTLSYFRDLYLPASRELFHNVGQSPQDVAKVRWGREPQDMAQVCEGAPPYRNPAPPWVPELRAPPHRSSSRSSAQPDHPCADRPTPAMLR